MKVVFTAEADAGLEQIGDYIAQGNPLRAVSFVDELVDRCLRLADVPLAYPLIPGHQQTGIRRRTHGRYLIFYRVNADVLEILRVMNGTRLYEKILFGDE